jgi:nicotinamide mononucleotide transporter
VIRELSIQLVGAWHDASWIELIAAGLAIAYVVLAIGQHIGCWAAAFLSSCLFVWIFFQARLYMDSVLNVFYAVMAVYGFWQWKGVQGSKRSDGTQGKKVPVIRLPVSVHVGAMALVLLLSWSTSLVLRRYTPAALPFLDSLEFFASIYATYLQARKVYENWHWFFVIDALCVGLYFNRRLFTTMLLFAAYLVLIVLGMREWRRSLPEVPAPA